MNRYFEKLPNIYYNNYLCKDISRRAKLVDDQLRIPYTFYPFEIKDQLRSDHIAEYYYDDAEVDWLIYMSNQIVDPYYQWYLSDQQFESLLISKYGSIENSQKLIAFYRNNWATDDTELSVSYYNNTIADSSKKYYSPLWGPGNKILSYKRKQIDTLTNLNRIVEYTISANTTPSPIIEGELVDIKPYGQQQTVGTGQVVIANSSIIRVKNVDGNTTANTLVMKTIAGEQSGVQLTVANSDVIFENISLTEQVFWSPVSFFDYEMEINEQKKNIKLIDRQQHLILINQFQQVVSEDVDPLTNLSTNTT